MSKELYRKLRALSCERLWEEEVPRFERGTARERLDAAGLIRAVGVVFAERGTPAQREMARVWLRGLLRDAEEKIRRYAMTALPKLGANLADEAEMLRLLDAGAAERERKFVGRSLSKIGGAATLAALPQGDGGSLRQTEQKVRASVARREAPSTIRLDAVLEGAPDLHVHLHCRAGLEQIVREEVLEQEKFQVVEVGGARVVVKPPRRWSLGELFELRCFATAGLVLGEASAESGMEGLAEVLTSKLALRLLRTFTAGTPRYRLEFLEKGHQRGAVRLLADAVYARCPEILNDAREAPWAVEIHPTPRGSRVELVPRLRPDPRFSYRRDDVPAASHPPLAAALARLAGVRRDEVIWDPFCGSGVELIERALLGGVRRVFGTDRSTSAIAIAKTNFAAANLEPIRATFAVSDFRTYAQSAELGPESVSLIITNPPMGKRVPVPDLRTLIGDLLSTAAMVLRSGGRLVFPNPVAIEKSPHGLVLVSRQLVDLGGFDCRLELYRKTAL